MTDLTSTIRAFINGWNARATPFVWTKTPKEILKSNRAVHPHFRRPLGSVLDLAPRHHAHHHLLITAVDCVYLRREREPKARAPARPRRTVTRSRTTYTHTMRRRKPAVDRPSRAAKR